MPRPSVNITLGNGNLARVATSSDGIAGMVLTGKAVPAKLELNKHYQLNSARDLDTLGIAASDNPLAYKEVRAFYQQAGNGAELHLVVVSEATTLTAMCDPADGPLHTLIDGSGGRISIVGVNKIAPDGYSPDLDQGIDGDAITAAEKAQATAEDYATTRIWPFRVLMPAPAWSGTTEGLYKPREGSYNRVHFVIASDEATGRSAAVGQALGRAAFIEPHQSLGRVMDGAVASAGYATNGKTYLETAGLADALYDAGYILYVGYPGRNGVYFSGDSAAAPLSDDYSELYLGRIVDKAIRVVYDTYISSILDNIIFEKDGTLPLGACVSYQGVVTNAIASAMGGQISDFEAYVDPRQNVLSSGQFNIECGISPQGVLRTINVNLGFTNPALKN